VISWRGNQALVIKELAHVLGRASAHSNASTTTKENVLIMCIVMLRPCSSFFSEHFLLLRLLPLFLKHYQAWVILMPLVIIIVDLSSNDHFEVVDGISFPATTAPEIMMMIFEHRSLDLVDV
jgi:hypothetical protein